MHCPFCQQPDTRVIDSRLTDDGAHVRAGAAVRACGERFTTFESVEFKLPMIVKTDGRREAFDAGKLRASLEHCAAEAPRWHGQHRRRDARPSPSACADGASAKCRRAASATGDERTAPLDQVAYVRFASVYRSFEDVQAFREEVEQLERDLAQPPCRLRDRAGNADSRQRLASTCR
jgi:transcriptional repressor NrdR